MIFRLFEGTAQFDAPAALVPRWISKGMWAFADQALFSGANFVGNVLLAKLLIPVEYGALTVALTTFLLLGTIHTALLTEPMLVFGPLRYRNKMVSYLRALLWGHLIVSGLFGIILIACGFLCRTLQMAAVGNALFYLAFSQPLVLFLWLMRRACYLESSPRKAALAGALYLILVVSGIVLLNREGMLTVMSSLAVMGAGSLVCASMIWVSLTTGRGEDSCGAMKRAVTVVHWKYGRWAAATGALGFLSWNIYYYLLPLFADLAATAALKAMVNISLPVLQAVSALLPLLLPALVRRRGTPSFARLMTLATGWTTGVLIAFWIAAGTFHSLIVREIYQGRYAETSSLLWIVGALPVAAGLSAVFSTALRAEEDPRGVFYATLAAAFASVTLGILLTAREGIRGAAVGMVAYFAIGAGILWLRSSRNMFDFERDSR
jgi:O-antigen/teichoic acid export membrane protein